MNTEGSMHLTTREDRLLNDALAALTRATGLKAVVARERKTRAGLRPDAVIVIEGDGRRFQFLAEIKAVDRAAALAAAQHQLERFGRQGVLIAPYITAELAGYCREKLNLQFIDTTGNAYLRAPGLYVFIRGERPHGRTATAEGTRAGATATALRVQFVLLCRPELLNAPYREIVAAAGVALGAVGWVFFDLQRRGYVTGGRRRGNRRWLEPQRLLEEWAINYPVKLRPKLNPRRFRAPEANWWQKTRLPDGALWGGEVAGNRLTGDLKPAIHTIYVDPARTRDAITNMVKQHRLRADPEGELEILDVFWTLPVEPAHPDLVPPLLAYADLMATLDPRNLGIAKRIREEYLEPALRRA